MLTVPFNNLVAQHKSLQPALEDAIAKVMGESSFVRGPEVEAFEQEFSEALGVRYCVSCGNGTDALFIGLKALGLKTGDEVITSAHSWISTSETVTLAGGRVVFCDTDAETFTIDVRQIEEKITARTKGIIPVHLFGFPADLSPVLEIAKRHGLWVIEDCAQAHGATYKEKSVGNFGDLATFSFYPGKNLGAIGDAGAVVTNREDLAQWMKLFARHGGKGDHLIEGMNSRMDGLQGAVLRVKLPHLKDWTRQRRAVANYYSQELQGCGDLILPSERDYGSHVYHLYVVRSTRRDELRQHLSRRGVETSLNYPRALPFYPAYAHLGHTAADFPVAYLHQQTMLSLPIYPELTQEQQAHVVACIREFFGSRN